MHHGNEWRAQSVCERLSGMILASIGVTFTGLETGEHKTERVVREEYVTAVVWEL